MNSSEKARGRTFALKEKVRRNIFGEVALVTASHDCWTVYVCDADDLPACQPLMWAGLPVKYTVMPRAAA